MLIVSVFIYLACDEFCPLNSFVELTRDYDIDNILKECELDDGLRVFSLY